MQKTAVCDMIISSVTAAALFPVAGYVGSYCNSFPTNCMLIGPAALTALMVSVPSFGDTGKPYVSRRKRLWDCVCSIPRIGSRLFYPMPPIVRKPSRSVPADRLAAERKTRLSISMRNF